MSATFWIKTLELILALSLLVIVHEFGHYFFARIFGIWVEKFYMFFNPKISIVRWDPKAKKVTFFKRNPDDDAERQAAQTEKSSWRDTIYGIGWVPLGGYCKIAGMIDESMDTEQMKQPAKPYEFRSKPAWKRLLVMIGGVLFNFLAAIVIYSGIVYAYGDMTLNIEDITEGMNYCDSAHKIGFQDGDIPLTADGKKLTEFNGREIQSIYMAKTVTVLRNHRDTVTINLPKSFITDANNDAENGQQFMDYRMPVVIAQTQPRMGAEKAGLKQGDRLLAVNNDTTPSYTEFTAALTANKGKAVRLCVLRDGKQQYVNADIDSDGKLGIQLMDPTKVYKVQINHYNLLQCIPRGIQMGWDKMVSYVKALKLIFTPEGAKSLGGFGAIGSIFPDEWNWLDFWSITAFLSVILAVMNILPIPALDGGHVLFLLYEIITGRQPSEKFLERAQTIGMALLFALLLFANGNDIYRFFFK
ncbi:MAG: RIP metalloprotease RseP [Muribaculaceae bacterium]|nr:RIP metalloprotease RseP [Muribaculaceae bacterium]